MMACVGITYGSVVQLGRRGLGAASVREARDGAGGCVVVGTVGRARFLAGQGPVVLAVLGGLDVSKVQELGVTPLFRFLLAPVGMSDRIPGSSTLRSLHLGRMSLDLLCW